MIEGEGGGIGEVQRVLSEWPADPPIFIDHAVTFTAILMRPGMEPSPPRSVVQVDSGDPQTRILTVLALGPLDRTSIAERTGLTRSQTRYALEKLIAGDRVVMNGGLGARNTTYSLEEE